MDKMENQALELLKKTWLHWRCEKIAEDSRSLTHDFTVCSNDDNEKAAIELKTLSDLTSEQIKEIYNNDDKKSSHLNEKVLYHYSHNCMHTIEKISAHNSFSISNSQLSKATKQLIPTSKNIDFQIIMIKSNRTQSKQSILNVFLKIYGMQYIIADGLKMDCYYYHYSTFKNARYKQVNAIILVLPNGDPVLCVNEFSQNYKKFINSNFFRIFKDKYSIKPPKEDIDNKVIVLDTDIKRRPDDSNGITLENEFYQNITMPITAINTHIAKTRGFDNVSALNLNASSIAVPIEIDT